MGANSGHLLNGYVGYVPSLSFTYHTYICHGRLPWASTALKACTVPTLLECSSMYLSNRSIVQAWQDLSQTSGTTMPCALDFNRFQAWPALPNDGKTTNGWENESIRFQHAGCANPWSQGPDKLISKRLVGSSSFSSSKNTGELAFWAKQTQEPTGCRYQHGFPSEHCALQSDAVYYLTASAILPTQTPMSGSASLQHGKGNNHFRSLHAGTALRALGVAHIWLLDNKRVYRLSTRPTISDVQKFTSAKGSKFRVIHVSNIGSTGQSCLIMIPMFQWQRNEVPSLIFQTNQVIILVIYIVIHIHIYILLYIYYNTCMCIQLYTYIHRSMKSHSSFIFCSCWVLGDHHITASSGDSKALPLPPVVDP